MGFRLLGFRGLKSARFHRRLETPKTQKTKKWGLCPLWDLPYS